MEFSLKRFLTDGIYRRSLKLMWRAKIYSIISKPRIFIESYLFVEELYDEYPDDPWKRYVKIKEREAQEKKARDEAFFKVRLIGVAFEIDMLLLGYVYGNSYDDDKERFEADKREALENIRKLRELNISVSPELEDFLKVAEFDSCKTSDEYQIFSQKLNKMMDELSESDEWEISVSKK